jgi:hypothetical protein
VPREVYFHVPDLSWPKWEGVARPLHARLRVPMTTEDVLRWSRRPGRDAGGPTPLLGMGASRSESYARNMLAWLSLQGMVDYDRGKWRRVRPTLSR